MENTEVLGLLKQIRELTEKAIGSLGASSPIKSRAVPKETADASRISYDLNCLAFMNKYAKGLSGAQKFTLLLAWKCKGAAKVEVSSQDIEKQWNSMRTVLGGKFNPVHPNRAKAEGWVDSPKRGFFMLSESWPGCIGEK